MADPISPDNAFGRVKRIEIQGRVQYQDTATGRFVSNDIGRVVEAKARAYGNISKVPKSDSFISADDFKPELKPEEAREQGLSKTRIEQIENQHDRFRLARSIEGIVTTRDVSKQEAERRLKKFMRERAEALDDFDLTTSQGREDFEEREERIRQRVLS